VTIENDFLPFAVGSGANVLSQADYASLTALETGFQAGTAQSAALNKVWRQSSLMSSVIAQFIVAQTSQAAIDDGTTATLLDNFKVAIGVVANTSQSLVDTGSANAYSANNVIPMSALPTVSGVSQTIKIANSNTGSSTYAPDGLAAAPIYGMGGQALQGGELIANGIATLISFVDPLLNSGSLCWVLRESVGGSRQVAPGTQSNQAVNFGQFASFITGYGYQKLPSGLIFQWGQSGLFGGNTNGNSITLPITFPNACVATFLQDVGSTGGSGTAWKVAQQNRGSVIVDCVNSTDNSVSYSALIFSIGY
jgi:hypothetical protein